MSGVMLMPLLVARLVVGIGKAVGKFEPGDNGAASGFSMMPQQPSSLAADSLDYSRHKTKRDEAGRGVSAREGRKEERHCSAWQRARPCGGAGAGLS